VNFSSKYLEKAVDEIATLPGIGRKTALRLALHLMRRDQLEVNALAESLQNLKSLVKHCKTCGNLSDHDICEICANPSRNRSLICVVEDIRDVMAIENTGQYRGQYHVLGGVISPMDGIGPSELNIEGLISRVKEHQPKEIIFGLGTTMEGETTAFYLYKKLKPFELTLSAIARGIAVGDQLEYADEVTLARSILNRTPYESSLNKN
jgi:recombination protein RecR